MFSASTREMKRAMNTRILVLILVLAGMICLPGAGEPVQDTTKIVIVSFRYLDGSVMPEGSRVIYGHPPDNIANRDLIAVMTAKTNASLGSYGIEEPRILYREKGSVIERDVRFAVTLPFSPAGDHVDLVDGSTGQKLATADIAGAIQVFCSGHRDDPDCGGGGASLFLYGTAALVVIVLLTAGFFVIRNRRKAGERR